MVLQPYAWEVPLLSQAIEAALGAEPLRRPRYDAARLAEAYEICSQLTAEHSRSFYMASALFPPEKRRAARALYAFCRISDDIVDRREGDVADQLYDWRRRALAERPSVDDPVAVAWADTRARYNIPRQYAEQLIEGVSRDLGEVRYETFAELAAYAYGVASTVGLMSMHITGFVGEAAIPYAVKLGVALQLTNILRDVGEDWRNDRVYLPQEEMRAYGLSARDLDRGVVHDAWRAFMRFQIARTRRLYDEAWSGIGLLDEDGRFAIGAAAGLYRGILDDIERNDYDVFSRRAYIGYWGKLRRLPGIYWRSRRASA